MTRARALAAIVALHLLALGCMPYWSDTHPEALTRTLAWQCPTPSPVPTRLHHIDHDGGPPGPEGTPETARRVYTTPVPTATPYVRAGSDFFAGQRVDLGGLLLSAAPQDDGVAVTVEVTSGRVEELHLGRSLVRLAMVDGRAREGAWSPVNDPQGGRWSGTQTVLLRFAGIARPQVWGLTLADVADRRVGDVGGKPVWFTLRRDPDCAKPGGPPSDAYDAPDDPGSPSYGRGGWPVPASSTISRGYGCHPFYTGTRGAGCPADAPWWHNGIDFACGQGCPLYAVRDGAVVFAGADTGSMDCAGMAGSQAPHTGYGLYQKLRDTAGYTVLYGHESGFVVTRGAVGAGQQIGRQGSTGCSTGAHTHISIYGPDGRERNPFDILERR